MSVFSKEDIQLLGDLNFKSRDELHHTGDLARRLLVLAGQLKDGTWRNWNDAEVISAMGANQYRADPRVEPILTRFANDLGLTVDWNYKLPTGIPDTPPAGSGNAVRYLKPEYGKKITFTDTSMDIPFDGYDIVTRPISFMGEVGVGGAPIEGVPLAMRRTGGIVFLLRQLEADTQEFRKEGGRGDRIRSGQVNLEPYDDGMRIIQGGYWAGGKFYHTRDDINTIAFDSKGNLSISNERFVDGEFEPGQLLVIQRETDAEGDWLNISIRPAGLGVRIGCNTQTGHLNELGLDDRMLELVKPIKNVIEKDL